jgi:pyruvate formate lyase activating enzyme
MTVEEVMAEIIDDGVFYDESTGGVTFSGGEPLTQPAFLRELLEACRGHGFRTAIDTCGFACTDVLLKMARLADLILFDLKLMDDAKHIQYTGVSNVPILANLKALDHVHANIWVRVPLIPGINDDHGNLEAVARFAASVSGVQQVSVLPYHKIGAEKFRRLGLVFPMDGVMPPTLEQVDHTVERFRSYGLTVKAGA